MAATPSISVCVCTYRRPQQLGRLVGRLAKQQPMLIAELVVVDNDARESAREAVERCAAPFEVRYDVQPRQNISLARNRSVEMASGEWLAFLDDDELPGEDWLARLWETAVKFDADAVLAPLLSVPPQDAPDWIRRGRFFERRRFATGDVVPRNEFRMSNALVRRERLARLQGPFDPDYGLTGGEDGDMLCRLARDGAKIVWCDEAPVTEEVESTRLTQHWLLMRAWRGGNDFARHFLSGHYGPVSFVSKLVFAMRAALQGLAALALTALSLPLGKSRWMRWLRTAYANAGKVAALRGRRYEEYAQDGRQLQ